MLGLLGFILFLASPAFAATQTEIIAQAEALYRPEAQAQGFNFAIEIEQNELSSASAIHDGKTMKVVLYSGLMKDPRSSEDNLRLTICHELGHLFGGAPRRHVPDEWDGAMAPDGLSLMTSEGQADHYASAVCFRRLVQGQDHKAELQKTTWKVNQEPFRKNCETSWPAGSEDALICQRAVIAGDNFLKLVKEFEISIESHSPVEVFQTITDFYPDRQCRLDTFAAGARCRTVLPLQLDFMDPKLGECAQPEGMRPTCWFAAKQ